MDRTILFYNLDRNDLFYSTESCLWIEMIYGCEEDQRTEVNALLPEYLSPIQDTRCPLHDENIQAF